MLRSTTYSYLSLSANQAENSTEITSSCVSFFSFVQFIHCCFQFSTGLPFHSDCFLKHLVGRRDDSGIELVSPLKEDQIRHLEAHVDVG